MGSSVGSPFNNARPSEALIIIPSLQAAASTATLTTGGLDNESTVEVD